MKSVTTTVFLALVTLLVSLASPIAPCHASLVDNGDNTVTQTRADGTRLMWLRDANQAATTGYAAYGTVSQYCVTPNPVTCYAISPQVGMSHANSLVWADTLDFAGHTDWRMASALDPDGTGPVVGLVGQGATGEMLNLVATEGISVSAPGPFSNMQLSYWTGSSGVDVDDGIWNLLAGSSSQSILQQKLVVVGPDAWVERRFAAWAVRDLPPVAQPAVPAVSPPGLMVLALLLALAGTATVAGLRAKTSAAPLASTRHRA